MDQKDYIEYISRLIDRDLQKKQANGFTLWAIVGVLFYLSLDLIDKVPVLLEWPHIKFYPFLIIVITINYLVFFVLLLYSLININSIIDKRKLITKYNSKNEAKYYNSILLIILGFLNLKAGNLIPSFMFNYFGIFFIYIAVRPFIKVKSLLDISKRTPSKKLDLKLNSKPQTIQRGEYISLISFSIILIIGLTFYFFNTSFLSDNSVVAITVAIELFACSILSIILVNQFIMLRASKWLADLEQDIYIYGLDIGEIRNRLMKEYFGQTIETWFSEEKKEYELIHESIERQYHEINLHFSILRRIRQDMLDKNFVSVEDEMKKYNAEKDSWINKCSVILQNLTDIDGRLDDISNI